MKWQIYMADLPPCRSGNGSEWKFHCYSSYWQMKCQIYWQIYPTPCRSANEYEWQFYSLSSYWQMKWQIYWQIYPVPCRSANGSEWQFHSLSSYWQMKWQIYWQIYSHPVDLPMDLNGNFTVTAHIGWWSGTSTGRSTLPPCRSANGSEWQFYSLRSIGRWSGRSIPSPSKSANGSEWQFYSLAQMNWQISGRCTPTP